MGCICRIRLFRPISVLEGEPAIAGGGATDSFPLIFAVGLLAQRFCGFEYPSLKVEGVDCDTDRRV